MLRRRNSMLAGYEQKHAPPSKIEPSVSYLCAGIFKDLATNAEAKDAIAQALKEQQAAEAGAKFV